MCEGNESSYFFHHITDLDLYNNAENPMLLMMFVSSEIRYCLRNSKDKEGETLGKKEKRVVWLNDAHIT